MRLQSKRFSALFGCCLFAAAMPINASFIGDNVTAKLRLARCW